MYSLIGFHCVCYTQQFFIINIVPSYSIKEQFKPRSNLRNVVLFFILSPITIALRSTTSLQPILYYILLLRSRFTKDLFSLINFPTSFTESTPISLPATTHNNSILKIRVDRVEFSSKPEVMAFIPLFCNLLPPINKNTKYKD